MSPAAALWASPVASHSCTDEQKAARERGKEATRQGGNKATRQQGNEATR